MNNAPRKMCEEYTSFIKSAMDENPALLCSDLARMILEGCAPHREEQGCCRPFVVRDHCSLVQIYFLSKIIDWISKAATGVAAIEAATGGADDVISPHRPFAAQGNLSGTLGASMLSGASFTRLASSRRSRCHYDHA